MNKFTCVWLCAALLGACGDDLVAPNKVDDDTDPTTAEQDAGSTAPPPATFDAGARADAGRSDGGADGGARDAGGALTVDGGVDGGAPPDDGLGGLGDLFGDAGLPGLDDLFGDASLPGLDDLFGDAGLPTP